MAVLWHSPPAGEVVSSEELIRGIWNDRAIGDNAVYSGSPSSSCAGR